MKSKYFCKPDWLNLNFECSKSLKFSKTEREDDRHEISRDSNMWAKFVLAENDPAAQSWVIFRFRIWRVIKNFNIWRNILFDILVHSNKVQLKLPGLALLQWKRNSKFSSLALLRCKSNFLISERYKLMFKNFELGLITVQIGLAFLPCTSVLEIIQMSL